MKGQLNSKIAERKETGAQSCYGAGSSRASVCLIDRLKLAARSPHGLMGVAGAALPLKKKKSAAGAGRIGRAALARTIKVLLRSP